jgi:dethiobiotin synthetase
VEAPLVVETAGGLLVPLRLDWLQIEQLQRWNLPVLLVARSGLGTLNHTLLSIEALRSRHLPLLGILLNGEPHPNNASTLESISGVPVLGCLPPLPSLDAVSLQQQWQALDLVHKLKGVTSRP